MQIHPSDLLLKETFQDPASRCERVSSHVRECPRCQERLKGLLSAHWASKPPDYEPAFGRSLAIFQHWKRIYAKEQAEAPRLLTTLLDQPVERQRLLLRNHPRFQTWSLCEFLLRHSHGQVFNDAAKAEELAQLALLLLRYLDSAIYGAERIEDLRARAWAYIGNSHRIRANFLEAEDAFETAFLHLREGTGDSLERAHLLGLKSSLRREQGRLAEAFQLLKRTASVFREAGECHSAGRSLVQSAVLHYNCGETEKSIGIVKEALAMLDPLLEPRAVVCAWHNLADYLATTGRLMEAQGILAKARPLYHQFPEPWVQSRLKWVEGKILLGLGCTREAQVILLAAHEGFLSANLPLEAATLHSEIITLLYR